MKFEDDIEHFKVEDRAELDACDLPCSPTNCPCMNRYVMRARAYEACIPRDFWECEAKDVKHNREAFDERVVPYVKRLSKARKRGYGLMLAGDNGVGKTMFVSWTLMQAARRGMSAFYVTLPQLAHYIKRGFNDRKFQERLEWYLTSDFVGIDEIGKERFKVGDDFMRVEFERIFKSRFDDGLPMLLATNMSMDDFTKMYGPTFSSMLAGKYQVVGMDPGDYRETMRARMDRDMGY